MPPNTPPLAPPPLRPSAPLQADAHTALTVPNAWSAFEAVNADYRLRVAHTPADLLAIQKLRFLVFNLELQEGLSSSYETGLDKDAFDAVCVHLLVEHLPSNTVVGTYRMQTGTDAQGNLGYYCEREFDFTPFEPIRAEVLELGRACIHEQHRSFSVLILLWRGIAHYAQQTGTRYLLGCSSLTSQDPAVAWHAFDTLRPNLAPEHLRTTPTPEMTCHFSGEVPRTPYPLPKLLAAYLTMGSWVCGPPAIDLEFKTIDFLTLVDLRAPESAKRRKRFGIF